MLEGDVVNDYYVDEIVDMFFRRWDGDMDTLIGTIFNVVISCPIITISEAIEILKKIERICEENERKQENDD